MRPQDDELLLTGHAVPGDDALVDVLRSMRAMAQAPAPAPSAELAALLRGAARHRAAPVAFPVLIGRAVRHRTTAAGRWVAGLGLAGKVVLGAGVAMAGVAGAATIPAVPDVVQEPAHTVLTDVGRAFGADGVSPSPSPSGTTTRQRDDDDAPRPVVTGSGDAGELVAGTSGGEDLGPTGTTASLSSEDGRTSQSRSGTGTGSPSAPGERSSTGQGSSDPKGSSDKGTSGDQGSSTDQGTSTGSSDWMLRKDPAPSRSPQPTASPSPRADAGSTTPSSDR